MPHDGWMDIAKPFIAAFKDGATSADSYVSADELVYWYRPTPKDLDCDATDTTMVAANNASGNYFEGRPNGYEDMEDAVFIVTLLTQPGTITVDSGGNVQEFLAPGGISAYKVNMKVGTQQFFLTRNGQTIMSAQSLKDISNVCPCGIYNFNAYVGTVPESVPDQLQPDGLNSLVAGLHVSTCAPTPSLGTVPITPTSTPGVTSPDTGTTSLTTSTSSPTAVPSSSSPTTTSKSTASTVSPSQTSSTSSPTPSPTGTCNAGTGPGNYVGLCSFSCNYVRSLHAWH